MENAEQNRARSLCYLPKNMTPNKEDFECINMTKAIAFFEKKDFKIGLTYIDKNYSTI